MAIERNECQQKPDTYLYDILVKKDGNEKRAPKQESGDRAADLVLPIKLP